MAIVARMTRGAMIEHIVGNFLSNAVKFSAPGAAIFLVILLLMSGIL